MNRSVIAGGDRGREAKAAREMGAISSKAPSLQAAQRNQLRVPEDLALVGFDDVSYAAHASVPLTTIAQQRTEMGLRAGILLMNRIEHGISGPTSHVELPTSLIIRQSCGARQRVLPPASLRGSEKRS